MARGKGRGRGGGGSTRKGGRGRGAKASTTEMKQEQVDSKGEGDDEEPLSGIKLADKKDLKRSDVTCPICWSVLFEPTTLPCNHSMCKVCLEKHLQDNPLNCPLCRTRISTWHRRKGRNSLDAKLWKRIQEKFPKLVEARSQGIDSQNILDDGEDEEDIPKDEPLSPSLLEHNDEDEHRVLDGTLCEPGEVKNEYESILEIHERDLERERSREEAASVSLSRQIYEEELRREEEERKRVEEDRRLAEQLALIENDPSKPDLGKTQSKGKEPYNSISNWVSKNCDQNQSSSKIGGMMQNKTKSPVAATRRNPSGKSAKNKSGSGGKKRRPSDPSRASQEMLQKFLSSSQNSQSLFDCSMMEQPIPSTSSGNISTFERSSIVNDPCSSNDIPGNTVRYSAFSPTKASNRCNISIPSSQPHHLPIPVSSSGFSVTASPMKPEESLTCSKSPDSIKNETDSYFKPIKPAPKTPPRKNPNGTSLDTKPIKSTPIRPTASSSVSAYIVSPIKSAQPTYLSFETSKPSCATMEKRVSNDSGRASDNESFSPTTIMSPKPEPTDLASNDLNGRGSCSDDYRVTPDDSVTDKFKKRANDKETLDESSSKRVKTDEGEATIACDEDCNDVVKQEPLTPVKIELQCSQGFEIIDLEDETCIEEQKKAMERIEQEEKDKKFAEKLQRQLMKEEAFSRGKDSRERYSIRNWLKPAEPPQTRTSSIPSILSPNPVEENAPVSQDHQNL